MTGAVQLVYKANMLRVIIKLGLTEATAQVDLKFSVLHKFDHSCEIHYHYSIVNKVVSFIVKPFSCVGPLTQCGTHLIIWMQPQFQEGGSDEDLKG